MTGLRLAPRSPDTVSVFNVSKVLTTVSARKKVFVFAVNTSNLHNSLITSVLFPFYRLKSSDSVGKWPKLTGLEGGKEADLGLGK